MSFTKWALCRFSSLRCDSQHILEFFVMDFSVNARTKSRTRLSGGKPACAFIIFPICECTITRCNMRMAILWGIREVLCICILCADPRGFLVSTHCGDIQWNVPIDFDIWSWPFDRQKKKRKDSVPGKLSLIAYLVSIYRVVEAFFFLFSIATFSFARKVTSYRFYRI